MKTMTKKQVREERGRLEAISYARKLSAGSDMSIKDFEALVEVLTVGVLSDKDAVEDRKAVSLLMDKVAK